MTSPVVKVLLTGCRGQVGWECCERVHNHDDVRVIATDIHNLDITDQNAVRSMIADERVDIVVNAAAYTAVDNAESDQELARAVNVTGPMNLAMESHRAGIPLFHISTDYVFDGGTSVPYIEEVLPTPESVYGETKLAGEQAVAEYNPRYITLRTSWVFGRVGGNFVKTMIRLAQEQDELSVVADQFGAPTYAGDLGETLLTLARNAARGELPWGLYHYTGMGPTTWHAFATQIVSDAVKQDILKAAPVVNPIRTEEFPTAAKRPSYSVLNCELFNRTFPEIGLRSWHAGLREVLTTIAAGDTSL